MKPNVHTWADGFGRWHARVPRNAAGALLAARRAIRDELTQRADSLGVDRHHFIHLEHCPDYDDGDTIVYAEPMTDPDECPRCDKEK